MSLHSNAPGEPGMHAGHCWNQIGVGGDGTCPELAAVIHCRNCPIYAQAGRMLFEQPPPPGYLAQWAEQVATPMDAEERDALSVVRFRLADRHLALPTAAFLETVEVRPIHRIPHRSSPILLGLANIRGELRLCVSLAALLGIETADAPSAGALPRLAVIGDASEPWAFPVDEMRGVHRVPRAAVRVVTGDPLEAARFEHGGHPVTLLDGEGLVAQLRRAVA